MKHFERPNPATMFFLLTLLFSLFLAPALRAQVLLQEDFDAAALGSPPSGWSAQGNSANVDPGQACSGNAFRMNQFANANVNNLDTPDLPRGNTPGTVSVRFDVRLADWNDNSQLTGSGSAFAQLFVNGVFAQDFVSFAPASFTNGCLTQTATFTTADIPLGADFKIRFLGVWSSGDWSYVIDNVDVRIVNDDCADAILLPQTSAPAGILDGNVVDGSFEGATQSQPGCTGNANDDVWYQFVATERSVSVSVQAGDVVWELFSGSCGNLTSLECKDGSSLNEFGDYHGVNVGETYYVRVYSFAGTPLTGTDAEFRIQIGTPSSVNDECASAEIITQSAATSCGTNLTMGTVENATESQTACAGTANDDVWYEFVATSTDFTVYVESQTDVVLQLFTGNCGSLTAEACQDRSVRSEILKFEDATVGQTYRFRVYSFGGTAVTGTTAEFGVCVFTTAAAPENDACANAIDIIVDPEATCGFPISGTTNGATRSEADALCPGVSGDASVWYSFTANAMEHFVSISDVSLQNGNDGELSSFEVFSGNCGARSQLFCSGQLFGNNPSPQLVTGLTPGDDYLIRVVTVNGINTIDFDICVTTPCPDSPSDLMVNNITATTAGLSHSYPFGIRRTHVVRLASNGATVFSQENLMSNANPTGLEPGTNYEYYVLETCDGSQNTIGPVAFTTKAIGDECVDAFSLTQSAATSCGTNLTMGSVEGATESLAGCTGTANDDVWYAFTATSTDFTVFLESGDFVVQLFEGSCGSLVSLDCEDRIPLNETFSYANATVGQTYYLRVYSFGNTPLTGTAAEFGICVFTTPSAPANDDCAAAITLAVNPDANCASAVAGTTNGASRPEADPRCSGINGDATVWYSFTATATEHFITLSKVELLNGTDNARSSFEVFSGSCGARTRVQCSGQLFGTNPGPQTVSGLTPGQEYLIRVIPVNPADQIDFDICITTDCPALATGLNVTDVTATTAALSITETDGEERDFIVIPAGETIEFGNASNHVFFTSSLTNEIFASGLSSNTAYDFYVGQSCNPAFAGPFTFTTRPSCGDVIYDTGGPNGNYGDNEDYTVTICPETADQSGGLRRVSITFDEFDVENGFDGITIYNGEDTNAPVVTSPGSGIDLWSWTRADNQGSGDLQGVTVFTTNVSGCITLRFTSDGSVTLPGFKATINCDLTADVFSTILTTVPAGSGAVTADKGYLSTASGYMYYLKEGLGSLIALNLGDTQAKVPFSGVTMVAGSGASNLGLNGCMAPYNTVPDWWVMNRTWDVVSDAAPASPVGVRFFYTQEDFDAIATNSGFAGLTHEQLSFYKINGGDEEDLTAPGNSCHDLVDPANYQEFDPGEYLYSDLTEGSLGTNAHQAQFMVNSFSGGGSGAGTNFGGSLPIELVRFTGEALAKVNRLNWTSSREENTGHHRLERSPNGSEWTTISTLAAAGNSAIERNYTATDDAPLSRALYRVTTVDLDGSVSFSPLVELVRTDEGNSIRMSSAYPSPSTGIFSVDIASAEGRNYLDLRLVDGAGREVLHRQLTLDVGWNTTTLNIAAVPAGVYWLRATDDAGNTTVKPVVKK